MPARIVGSISLTRNWLAQVITASRTISSQARFKRNALIIYNQSKCKSSLFLLAKLRKPQSKRTSVEGRYNGFTLQISGFFQQILQVNGFIERL